MKTCKPLRILIIEKIKKNTHCWDSSKGYIRYSGNFKILTNVLIDPCYCVWKKESQNSNFSKITNCRQWFCARETICKIWGLVNTPCFPLGENRTRRQAGVQHSISVNTGTPWGRWLGAHRLPAAPPLPPPGLPSGSPGSMLSLGLSPRPRLEERKQPPVLETW